MKTADPSMAKEEYRAPTAVPARPLTKNKLKHLLTVKCTKNHHKKYNWKSIPQIVGQTMIPTVKMAGKMLDGATLAAAAYGAHETSGGWQKCKRRRPRSFAKRRQQQNRATACKSWPLQYARGSLTACDAGLVGRQQHAGCA